MELFPISLKLKGRRAVVVGAGKVAAAKMKALLRAGAELVVVAPRATPWVRGQAAEKAMTWRRRPFAPADLDTAFLVIAATDSAALNQRVFRAARRRGVLCNVVDDPEHCDFFYPAVVRRGALQIAISTGGRSPALAHRLRVELERQFPSEYGEWVDQVGRKRRTILREDGAGKRRRKRLEGIASRKAFHHFAQRRKLRAAP